MDACRAAVKALRNSPAAVRRKISSTSGRRQKLREEWLNEEEAVTAGISFYVKFLGSVEVSSISGQECTDAAVRIISRSAKQQKEKLEKISVRVSSRSVRLATLNSDIQILEYPIYRVTYCTVDSNNDKVMAFIAQCPHTLKMLCYAFLCNNKSKAWAITLSIAQAFTIAFDRWEVSCHWEWFYSPKYGYGVQGFTYRRNEQALALTNGHQRDEMARQHSEEDQRARGGAIDLASSNGSLNMVPIAENGHPSRMHSSNGDSLSSNGRRTSRSRSGSDTAPSDDELNVEFTRLALSRSTPNLLAIGLDKAAVCADDPFADTVGGGDKLVEFRNGDNNPAVLYRMVSREDLLE